MNMDASEGPSLARDEQLEVLRVCARQSRRIAACFRLDRRRRPPTRSRGARSFDSGGADALAVFPPFPVFLGNPVPTEMIYRYHKAIGDGVGLPLIAFQFPKAWGPDFPPDCLRELVKIRELVGLKEASFDTTKTIETIATAKTLPRKLGIMTGSDTFILEAMIDGLRRRADRLRRHRDRGAGSDASRRRRAAISRAAFAIWERLGPLARFCWRAPIRDYRPRMKEVLKLQGLIPHAAVRPPQLGVDDAERAELSRLAERAGLINRARRCKRSATKAAPLPPRPSELRAADVQHDSVIYGAFESACCN